MLLFKHQEHILTLFPFRSNLAQVQYDMDALSVALERRSEELEKAMHEYEERLDLEHKKSDEKLRFLENN